jgi:lysophospholipase L1-like esterase
VNGSPISVENATAPRVVFYGDSLTNGNYDQYIVLSRYKTGFTASGPTPITKDFSTQRSGYGGLTAATGLTYAPEFLDPYYQSRSPVNIAMIWLGTNDIALDLATPATTWTRIQALAAAAKAKGFKVCVGTSISRVGNDTNLTTLNGLITAGWAAAGINCLVNFASDPNLAPNGTNYSNLAYYSSDQIHLNEAGKGLAAAVAQTALNTYIATFTGPTPAEFNAPGNMTAAGLATAGTIAGSLCRTSTGTFIYKAGANCF